MLFNKVKRKKEHFDYFDSSTFENIKNYVAVRLDLDQISSERSEPDPVNAMGTLVFPP